MFKNIEIVVIDKNAVLNSLYIPVLVMLAGFFLLGWIEGGFFYGVLTLFFTIVAGTFYWVGTLAVMAGLEFLFIRNRATEKTVLTLLLIETILPFTLVFLFLESNQLNEVLYVCGCFVVAQGIRWVHLKLRERMFHKAKR